MAPPNQEKSETERGTTLVEAALVSLPFFLILFGVLEMGFLFRNYLTTTNTASEASRAASVFGSAEDADYQIMRSAEHGIAAVGLENLEMLVIFRADGPGASVPPSCVTSGSQTRSTPSANNTDEETHPAADGAPECNVYLPGDFGLTLIDDPDGDGIGPATGNFGCYTNFSVDRHWCPFVRDDAVSGSADPTLGPGDGTDYVGIYVQVNHQFLTGFFQSTATLKSTKIVRIEPERN